MFMKIYKKLIRVLFILLLPALASFKSNAQPAAAVTLQVFYDQLSPFGTWLHDPVNGYVWVPKVEKGFRPYFTNGSWKMTEYGTVWISSYAWGWAPFHYGRWVFDSLYGWVWIPGLEWGPAWVVWRTNADYYGWTPLTPGFNTNNSFSPDYTVPADWWVFVPSRYLLSPAFHKHVKSGAQNNIAMMKTAHIIKNTYTANNTNYISGPRAQEYARASGQHVDVYMIKNAAKPGKAAVSQNEITLYKPAVKKWESGKEPIPAKSVHAAHTIGKLAALGSAGEITQHQAQAKKKTKSQPKPLKKQAK